MEPRKLQRDRIFGRQAVEVCYSRNSVHKSYSRGSYSLNFLLGGSERVGLKVVEKRVWARSKSLGFYRNIWARLCAQRDQVEREPGVR